MTTTTNKPQPIDLEHDELDIPEHLNRRKGPRPVPATEPAAISAETAAISAETVLDPFSPQNFRLSQDFAETVGVKKLLKTVPVRKPHKQEWVRVRPEPEYRDNLVFLELEEDREIYLITAGVAPELVDDGDAFHAMLFTAITKQGVLFLWPAKLPTRDGKDYDWWRSSREAAVDAMAKWTRVKSNMHLGAYESFEPKPGVVIAEPEWPEHGFWDLIRVAFRDRLIDRYDHPVLQKLRDGK